MQTPPPTLDGEILHAVPAPFDIGGLRRRRFFAWAVDALICSVLVGLASVVAFFVGALSFGLFLGPAGILVALVPLIYHAGFVSGVRGATWGQRMMGIEFIDIVTGARASFLQAVLHFVLFYLSVGLTAGLIVIWSLFAPAKALLHDQLTGLRAQRSRVQARP